MGFTDRGFSVEDPLAHEAITEASELAVGELSREAMCSFIAGPLTNSTRASEHRRSGQATGEILVEAINRELPDGVRLDWSHIISNMYEVAAERVGFRHAA